MANEKKVVGKDGAQQLYLRIKGLIPPTDQTLNESSTNPISNRAVFEALRQLNIEISRFTSYLVVDSHDEHGQPIVAEPSTRYIYLVKMDEQGSHTEDIFAEWIWCVPQEDSPEEEEENPGESGGGVEETSPETAAGDPQEPYWQCIGTTAVQPGVLCSWMQWSLDNGSTDDNDGSDSIFIGKNLVSLGESILIGYDNTTDREIDVNNRATIIGYGNTSTTEFGELYAPVRLTEDEMDDFIADVDGQFESMIDDASRVIANEYPSDYYDWRTDQLAKWYNIVHADDNDYDIQSRSHTLEYDFCVYFTSRPSPSKMSRLCTPWTLMPSAVQSNYRNAVNDVWDAMYSEDPDAKTAAWEALIAILRDYLSAEYIAVIQKAANGDELSVMEEYDVELALYLEWIADDYYSPDLANASLTYEADAKKMFYYAVNIDFMFASASEMRRSNLSRATFHRLQKCNSIIAGVDNDSAHHNSILIGSGNVSLPWSDYGSEPDDSETSHLLPRPPEIPPEGDYTDDDGFGIALGNCNTVGRNYDIAMGFKTYSRGGENFAVHQSVARGCRNIAMINSSVVGVANVGLMESILETELTYEQFGEGYCARNLLFNAKVSNLDADDSGVLTDNVAIDSVVLLKTVRNSWDYNGYGYQRNLFAMISEDYYNGTKFSISAYGATDNMFFGDRELGSTSEYWNDYYDPDYAHSSIDIYGSLVNNLALWSYQRIESWGEVNHNLFAGASIRIPTSSSPAYERVLSGNVLLESDLFGKDFSESMLVNSNIATQSSLLDITTPTNWGGNIIHENVLMNGAYFKGSDNESVLTSASSSGGAGESYWGWNLGYFGHDNVLFSAYGEGLTGCFSISENTTAISNGQPTIDDSSDRIYNKYGDGSITVREAIPLVLEHMDLWFGSMPNAWMINSRSTANFGDNFIGAANASFVSGEGNVISGVNFANIHGGQNLVNNSDGGIAAGYGDDIEYLTINGRGNKIFKKFSEYFTDLRIHGNYNHVYGMMLADCSIFGTDNDISGFDPMELSAADVTRIQERYINTPSLGYPEYFIAKNTGPVNIYFYDGQEWELVPYGTIFTGKIYQFVPGDPSGNTGRLNIMPAVYETDSTDDIFEQLSDALDVYESAWRDVNEYGGTWDTYVSTLPKYVPPTKLPGSDEHDPYMGILINRVNIFGQHNHIGSFNIGHTIFGQDNRIINTITKADQYSDFCFSNSFVQGNDNVGQDGSNQVLMGNGIRGIGHNTVALGDQLISNKWQTVIGKYNKEIQGPVRSTDFYHPENEYEELDTVYKDGKFYEAQDDIDADEPWDDTKWKEIQSPDRNSAVFIIGNGYCDGEAGEGPMWQDEQYIHRSNALEVYADGTVKARRFVSTEDEAVLTEGDGIHIVEDAVNGEVTISIKAPDNPERRHVLEWDPVEGKVKWVEVGMYIPE